MTKKMGVQFMFPGMLFSEQGRMQEMAAIPDQKDWPAGAYGAQLYTWTEMMVDGELLSSGRKEVGPQHIIGTKKDRAAVEAEGLKVCADNMRINGWDYVIACRQGHIAPSDSYLIVEPRP